VSDLATQLQAWQFVMPFWASFTSLTAARLRGWWLPPTPGLLPLFVASGPADRIARPGLHVCRHDVLPPWELVQGVRVPSAAETVLSCARYLALLDVIVIGDAALHAGDVTLDELIGVSRLRRRGSPLLRQAIPLMCGKAESIFEGLLRILHEICGISVQPQSLLFDADGTFAARADLLLTGTHTLHEFDGGHHRTPHEQGKDLRRERRLMRAGYQRRGFTARDVLTSPVDIIKDAEASLGWEHDPARMQAWYALFRESLFSSSGQRRLEIKLGLSTENADESLG
jgi:very-short-patch-repair endonuclease